ncbi:MAG: cyclic nucleotide-binding domain-containing protein [Chloroflexi bacterium]|nr:cyclic nucleotide-binding domain-containing protein [Chloroflexota bacterium]
MTTAAIFSTPGQRPTRIVLAIAANASIVAGAAFLGLGLVWPGTALIVLFPVFVALALGTARRRLMHIPEARGWYRSVHWPALAAGLGVAAAVAILITVVEWPVGYAEAAAAVLFFTALFVMYESEIGGERESSTAFAGASSLRSMGLAGSEYETLRNADMLRALDAGQLRDVLMLGARRAVAEGESLGEAGRLGEKVYVVLRNEAQLTANTGFGPMTVRVAGPGETFPLASLVGYGMLVTSARAMREMDVWEIDRQRLLDLCQRRPEIGARIFAAAASVMASRYRDTLKRLAEAANQTRAGMESSIQV